MATSYYETTLIINASLEEDQITQAVDRISDYITKHGGEITNTDHWGRRRLAYPIAKKNNGYYVQFSYNAPGELIDGLKRITRIDDAILRELTIVMTERDLRRRDEARAALIAAEEAEQEAQQRDDDGRGDRGGDRDRDRDRGDRG